MAKGVVFIILFSLSIVSSRAAVTNVDLPGAVVYNGYDSTSEPTAKSDNVFLEADGEGGAYVASRGYLAHVGSDGSVLWSAKGAAIDPLNPTVPRTEAGDSRAFVSVRPGPTPNHSARVALLQDADNLPDSCTNTPCPDANWFLDIFDAADGTHLHRTVLNGRVGTDGHWNVKLLAPHTSTVEGVGSGPGWMVVYEHSWCKALVEGSPGCLAGVHINMAGKLQQDLMQWTFPYGTVNSQWLAASPNGEYLASGVWGKISILGDPSLPDSVQCLSWLPGTSSFASEFNYVNIVFDGYRDHVYAVGNMAANPADRSVFAYNYKTCTPVWHEQISGTGAALSPVAGVGPISVAPDRVVVAVMHGDPAPSAVLQSFGSTAGGLAGPLVEVATSSLSLRGLVVSCSKAIAVSTDPEVVHISDIEGMTDACTDNSLTSACATDQVYFSPWGQCVRRCTGGYKVGPDGATCELICPQDSLFAYGWCNPDTGCAEGDYWTQELNSCATRCPIMGDYWSADAGACVPQCPYDGPTVYNANTGICDYRCTLEPEGVATYNHTSGECDWNLTPTVDTVLPGSEFGKEPAVKQMRGPDGGVVIMQGTRAAYVTRSGDLAWSRHIHDFNERYTSLDGKITNPFAAVVPRPDGMGAVLVTVREVDRKTVYGLFRSAKMFTGTDVATGEDVFRFYRKFTDVTIDDFEIGLFETGRNSFLYFYYSRINYNMIRAEEYSLKGVMLRHLEFSLPSGSTYHNSYPFTYSSHGNGHFAFVNNVAQLSYFDVPAPSSANDASVIAIVPNSLRWKISVDPFYTVQRYIFETQYRISDTTGHVLLFKKNLERSDAATAAALMTVYLSEGFAFSGDDGSLLWKIPDLLMPSAAFGADTKIDVAGGQVAFSSETLVYPHRVHEVTTPAITEDTVTLSPECGSTADVSNGYIRFHGPYVTGCHAEMTVEVGQTYAHDIKVSVRGMRTQTAFARGRMWVTTLRADGSDAGSHNEYLGFAYTPGEDEVLIYKPKEPAHSIRIRLAVSPQSDGSYHYKSLRVSENVRESLTAVTVYNESDGSRAAVGVYDQTGLKPYHLLLDCAGVNILASRSPDSSPSGHAVPVAARMDLELGGCEPSCSEGEKFSFILSRCVADCGGDLVRDEAAGACVPRCAAGMRIDSESGDCVDAFCPAGEEFDAESGVCTPVCAQWQALENGQCRDLCPSATNYFSPTLYMYASGALSYCEAICSPDEIWLDQQCTMCPANSFPNTNKDGCVCTTPSQVIVDGQCAEKPCTKEGAEEEGGIFFESGAAVHYLKDGGFEIQQAEWAATNSWGLHAATLTSSGCRSGGQCLLMESADDTGDVYAGQWTTKVNQVTAATIEFGGYFKYLTSVRYTHNSIAFNADITLDNGEVVYGVHVSRPIYIPVGSEPLGEWIRVAGMYTPPQPIKSVSFYAMFRQSEGRVMVDDLFFSKPAQNNKCTPCDESCAECFGPGPDHCSKCPGEGQFVVDGYCKTACSPGQYSNGQDCLACPAGTFNPVGGALSVAECQPCANGHISLAGATQCAACPLNHVTPDGVTCVACGDSTPNEELTACEGMCPPGQFSSSGYAPCDQCAPGTFASRPGSKACASCPGGMVASSSGSTACDVCTSGLVTYDGVTCGLCGGRAVASLHQNECLCSDGLAYIDGDCRCPASTHSLGTYRNYLVNGGFEESPVTDDTSPQYHLGWFREAGATIVDQGCLSGSRCMRVTSTETGGVDVYAAQWGADVSQTEPGRTFVLGGWYRADLDAEVVDELTILVDVVFTDGTFGWGVGAVYRNSFLRVSKWTKAEVTYTTPPGKMIDSFSMYCIVRNTRGSILFDDMFFYEPETCSACHPGCSTCEGPAEDQCTECPAGHFLHNGVCGEVCPSKTFADPATGACAACDASCIYECAGPGPGACVLCGSGDVNVGGECRTKCPAGSFSETGAGPDCTLCGPGQTSTAGATACQLCPAGKVAVGGVQCVSCPEGIAAAADQSTCLCPATTVFDGVACVCPTGTMDENRRIDYIHTGGFETVDDRWILQSGASVTTHDCHTGSKCLRLNNAGVRTYAAQYDLVIGQTSPAEITLAVWQRVEAGSTTGPGDSVAYISAVFADDAEPHIDWSAVVLYATEARGEWVYSVGTFSQSRAVASVSVTVVADKVSTLYFDDIEIYRPARGAPSCVAVVGGMAAMSARTPSPSPVTMALMQAGHCSPPSRGPGIEASPHASSPSAPTAHATMGLMSLGAAAAAVAVAVAVSLAVVTGRRQVTTAKASEALERDTLVEEALKKGPPTSGIRRRTATNERDCRV